MAAQNDKLEKGLAQPLLTSTEHVQDDDGDQECDASEEASEDSRRPANSLKAAYRLLTPSVKVNETNTYGLMFFWTVTRRTYS